MTQEMDLKQTIEMAMLENVEKVAPNFRKNIVTEEEIQKIIMNISVTLRIPPALVLIGTFLLFLQGAANAGTPPTMSVEVGDRMHITKKNLMESCKMVTGNLYIRRIAESLAVAIGDYAERNNLSGELAKKINNKLKAETGESLNTKEMAFCSSFSQSIPNLEEKVSERLAKLLAEDYKERFDNKNTKVNKIRENFNDAGKTKKKKGK